MSFLDLVIYLSLGALTLFAFQYAGRWAKALKFDWRTWMTVALAIFFTMLAFAWAYASLVEHEIQAAWVGLFIFGGLGLVFALLTKRFAQEK